MVFLTCSYTIKSSSDKFGHFSESEKKKLKKYEELINFLLKRYKVGNTRKPISEAIKKTIKSEKLWMDWKNEGCPSYDKNLEEKELKKFSKGQPLVAPNYVKMGKMMSSIKKWLRTDVEYSHIDALDKEFLMVFFPFKIYF